MKRNIVFVLVIAALLAVAAQCQGAAMPVVEKVVKETVIVEKEVEKVVTPTPEAGPELATTIRVDSLSEETGANFEALVIRPFAEEMGVEIEVEHGTYGSQEEWLASVRAAPGDYCIATYLSDFGLYSGVAQGLLQPFRLENMPNYANLEDRWEKRVIVEGDPEAYVATIDIGMYTFVYALEEFEEHPSSYAPLFDPQNAGRIALRDYALYRILQTASFLGLDPNNLSEEDVDTIFETMEQQAELVRAYWQSSSQLDQLLANREIWLADYWFDTVTRVGEDGTNKLGQLDLGWWFPEEGGPLWAGGPAIAAGCEGVERTTAELILNYMLQSDVFVKYVTSQGYIPTLEEDKYDAAAFFAGAPHRAAYQQAILDTGILLNVAKIQAQEQEWNERYEEMKLAQ